MGRQSGSLVLAMVRQLLDSGAYSVDEFVEDVRMRIKILKENKK